MAWPKGKPRPPGAGRQPGSKNKRTSVLELCEASEFDPFAEMIRIAKTVDHERQFDAVKELCQYIEAKKKALEVSGSLSADLTDMAERLSSMSKTELQKLVKDESK